MRKRLITTESHDFTKFQKADGGEFFFIKFSSKRGMRTGAQGFPQDAYATLVYLDLPYARLSYSYSVAYHEKGRFRLSIVYGFVERANLLLLRIGLYDAQW